MNRLRKPIDELPEQAHLHAEVNAAEDTARDFMLWNDNVDALHSSGGLNVAKVFADFVDKRKKLPSMLDRLDLLTRDDRYRNIVKTVELGMVTSEEDVAEIDGLKLDYEDMIEKLKERDDDISELPRESYRAYGFLSKYSSRERIVIDRRRVLALGSVAGLGYAIQKRNVMELPTELYFAIAGDDLRAEENSTCATLDRQIDTNNSLIYPIRTSYIALNRPDF